MPQERVRPCLGDEEVNCPGSGVETSVPADYVHEAPYTRENLTHYVCDTCKRGWFVYKG